MIIGSIGVGLFILIIIWILALIIFVVGVKLQSNLAWIALASATILTILLILIPTEQNNVQENTLTEKDYHFVYSTIFLTILLSTALISFLLFFILHCVELIHPKPIKQAFLQY